MKLPDSFSNKNWVPYTIGACIAIAFYFLLANLPMAFSMVMSFFRVIAPVLAGVIIAYLLYPAVSFFYRKPFGKIKARKAAWGLSMGAGIFCCLLVIVLLLVAIIPQLADSFSSLARNLGGYLESMESNLAALPQTPLGNLVDLSALVSFGDTLVNTAMNAIPDNIDGILNTSYSFGSRIVSILIGFILSIYFLMDKERLSQGLNLLLKNMMSPGKYTYLCDFCRRCDKILRRYIQCSLLEAAIVGIGNFLFMIICGMPYAPLISIVVGVTNLAPTFGPMIGAVIGALILVLVDIKYMVLFLLFTLVIQTLDGYVIKPKLFGDTLGVSSLLILITIVVGGRLFGMAGILLAIPAAAILEFMIRDILERKHLYEKK